MSRLAVYHQRAQRNNGEAVANPTVSVVHAESGAVPNLFSDRAGQNNLSNPHVAVAEDGWFKFHVRGGVYHVTASGLNYSKTWEFEAIGTAAEYDANAVRTRVLTGDGTLEFDDSGGIIEYNSASDGVLTIPANADVSFLIGAGVTVVQKGAGKLQVVGAPGVTVESRIGDRTAGENAMAVVYQSAEDLWIIGGDLTP